MSMISKIRSAMYKSARILGDIEAVRKGTVDKRIKNRIKGRIAGKILGKLK